MSPAADGGASVPLAGKALAAGSAAVVSAVLMNPFQLVSTRMQAAGAGAYRGVAACGCGAGGAGGAANAARVVETRAAFGSLAAAKMPCGALPAHCAVIAPGDGALGALSKIVRHEGVAQLWRGTSASLAMAVPLVGVYMPCYEALREALLERGANDKAAPLLAGAISRTLAVSVVAPIDFARTRLQAEAAAAAAARGGAGGGAMRGSGVSGGGVVKVFEQFLRRADRRGYDLSPGRVRALWTGIGPTLMRDVPFSALYWAGVEGVREGITRGREGRGLPTTPADAAAINMAAGTASGALAALVTTPLDVVKTRLQVRIAADAEGFRSRGELAATAGELRAVAREGGVSALFTGVVPRVARLAPSCGIVLVSYEVVKRTFGPAA